MVNNMRHFSKMTHFSKNIFNASVIINECCFVLRKKLLLIAKFSKSMDTAFCHQLTSREVKTSPWRQWAGILWTCLFWQPGAELSHAGMYAHKSQEKYITYLNNSSSAHSQMPFSWHSGIMIVWFYFYQVKIIEKTLSVTIKIWTTTFGTNPIA